MLGCDNQERDYVTVVTYCFKFSGVQEHLLSHIPHPVFEVYDGFRRMLARAT